MNKTTEYSINMLLTIGIIISGSMMWRAESPIMSAILSIVFATCSSILLMHFASVPTEPEDKKID